MSVNFDPGLYLDKGPSFSGIAELQATHDGGHYFMVEQDGEARLLPPDWDLYLGVVQYARRSRPINWRFNREERLERGGPIIEAVIQKWREVNGDGA